MSMKYALCGVALAALVTPALAANEFYVVQDTASKKCSIAEQKPTVATHHARGHGRLQDAGRGRDRNEGRQDLRGEVSAQLA